MSRRVVIALTVAALVVMAGCAGPVGSPPDATSTGQTTTEAPPSTTTTDTASTTQASPTSTTTTGTETGAGTNASPNGTLAVHFINVGQGASTLIVGPTGDTILIDTGGWQADGEDVLAALDRANVTRIDHLVTTHADADHIGGHEAVIDHFETEGDGIGAVYDPGVASSSQTYEEYLDAVERHDVTLYRTFAGDSIPMEGANVSVLGPPEELFGDDRNENSIVLRVTFGDAVFLLTGDVEFEGERYLLENYGSELRSTVLQAGHHGSRSSSGPRFLDAVRPQLVVFSSAYDSPYGHPHQEVLDRFAARSVPAVWTATHGTVVVTTDGAGVSVRGQATAPTAPGSLRDAPAVEPGTSDPPTVPIDPTANGTGGNATADSGPLRLAVVHADADGADGENLNDEYVVLENVENESLDLSGWTVADDAGHNYTVPEGTTLAPGATVTLHTGAGEDTATDLYWGADSPVWNNAGDTVIVRKADGTVVLEEPYDGG